MTTALQAKPKTVPCLACLDAPGTDTKCTHDECRDLPGCLYDNCPECGGTAELPSY